MDDKKLALICLIITLASMLLLVLTYKEEFEQKTLTQLMSEEEGSKGLLFGKVAKVIKSSPTTVFLLADANSAIVFYSKETDLAKDDLVYVYAEKQLRDGKTELYAYKVVKDT